ncbi:MAG: transcriptional repressor [Actinobacteria bacterium]|nr:transcriptional repressor [Actinomycetota bacterium]
MERDGHTTIEDRLRRTRQRYTAGRRQLAEVLAGAGRPLAIPELRAAGVDQSQSSVYRNLAILEQCGVVRRLASSDDTARFELAEDLTGHHHHLVCSDCGTIEDIALSPAVESALAAAVDEARSRHDFSADAHRFELVGSCADCA